MGGSLRGLWSSRFLFFAARFAGRRVLEGVVAAAAVVVAS
jgi:hypothetical protein